MYLNILNIKGFEVSALFEVEDYQNGYYLAVRDGEFAIPVPFSIVFF